MTKLLTTLTVVLALVAPAYAGENFYEYGMRVFSSAPQMMRSPGRLYVTVDLPGYGIMQPAFTKHCTFSPQWDGSEVPWDEYTRLQSMPTNYYEGRARFAYTDTHPGRVYQVCVRQPFISLEEEEHAR